MKIDKKISKYNDSMQELIKLDAIKQQKLQQINEVKIMRYDLDKDEFW
jgi:hypothetical protein